MELDQVFSHLSLGFSVAFSPLNLFEGRVDSGQLATPLGKVLAPGLSEGARMVCCLRPQDIMLAAHDKRRGSPAREYIEGRVLSRRFAGIAEVLEIGIAGIEEPLRARIRAGSLEPGANLVRVGFDEKAVMVFPAG